MPLSEDSRFLFTDVEGYTPHISRLLKMMYYTNPENKLHKVFQPLFRFHRNW